MKLVKFFCLVFIIFIFSFNLSFAAEEKSVLEITNHSKEVEIEKGWTSYANVGIKNSGEETLYDIEIKIKGIDEEWAKIPEKIESLSPGKRDNFTIKITAPSTSESDNYNSTFFVSSGAFSDEENFVLRIFSSKKEQVHLKIQSLVDEMENIERELEEARKNGKSVKNVEYKIEEIRSEILIANEYLDRKVYDNAEYRIELIKELLDEAREELEKSKKGISTNLLNPYLILPLAFLIIFIFYARKKKVKLRDLHLGRIKPFFSKLSNFSIIKKISLRRPNMSALKRIPIKIKGFISSRKKEKKRTELTKLRSSITKKSEPIKENKERDRKSIAMDLLEREYREGLISKESYEEMKGLRRDR